MSMKYLKRGVNILKKYRYTLKGLDCANCAREVEEHLAKCGHLKQVSVNFSTLKLTFTSDYSDNVKEYVQKLVREVEPDVQILDDSESYAHSSGPNFAIIRLITGLLLVLCTYIFSFPVLVTDILVILAYIILLSRTFMNAMKLLFKGTINESFLITISCIGAYIIGERLEGLMVILLYEFGKILEDRAINKSRKSISSLLAIKPEHAMLENGTVVEPTEVKIDDIIIVKPGEKIPLDGIVISGISHLNMASLTGESALVEVKEGMSILSGAINEEGVLKIRVTDVYSNSTVNKILQLVENATDKKTKTETFVNKVSKIYTPIVIILAVLVAIFLPLFTDVTYGTSIYRALTFLVISCPCAIAISVPLSYFSGIGVSSKHGILIKGSNYLDNLVDIKEIVFDKTGTLTTGIFGVRQVKTFNNYTEAQALELAALGESFSNHPIAHSILDYYGKNIDNHRVSDYQEIAGLGISYCLDNQEIKVGNAELVSYKDTLYEGTNVFVSVDGTIVGCIILNDEIKADAKKIISLLHNKGIKTSMFTGDNKKAALSVGHTLELDDIKYEMLPTDKYSELEKKIKRDYQVAFVGDGINDAPVLALASIGISMGLNGTSAAIEASDIVIMTDNLTKIAKGIDISRFTHKIIKQNLLFAIFVKILILTLSIIGISSMWQAIFADVGVTLITIFNTLRILKLK